MSSREQADMYRCRIIEADFETGIVTLQMEGKYTVSAGPKFLCDSEAIEQAVLQSPEVQALTEWKEWPLEMPPLTSAPVLAFNRHTKEAEIVYGSLLDEVDDYSHWIPLPPPPTK